MYLKKSVNSFPKLSAHEWNEPDRTEYRISEQHKTFRKFHHNERNSAKSPKSYSYNFLFLSFYFFLWVVNMAWLSSQVNPKHSQKTFRIGIQYLEILQPEICYGADFSLSLLGGTRLQRYSWHGIMVANFNTAWGLFRISAVTQLSDSNTQLRGLSSQLRGPTHN